MFGINPSKVQLTSNYLLYENETQRIEVAGWFHNIVLNLQKSIETIHISTDELVETLDIIEAELKERNIILSNIILPSTIPVIKFCEPFLINKPFDIFNEILRYLVWFPSLLNAREEIAEAVECFSDKKNQFYCNIWGLSVNQIYGYVLGVNEQGEQLLFLFGIKERYNE